MRRSMTMLAAFTLAVPAAAQVASPAPPPPTQLPAAPPQTGATPSPAAARVALLDAALAAKDYLALGPMIGNPPDQAAMVVDLDWLRDRMIRGTTSFVALLYARSGGAAKPGVVGRQVEVIGDGHYRPKEIPLAERLPKMAAARAALPTTLAALGNPAR